MKQELQAGSWPGRQSTALAQVSPDQMARVMRTFLAGFAPESRITMRYALRRAADDLGFHSGDGSVDHLPWHTLNAAVMSDLLYKWREEIKTSTIRLYMFALRGIASACFVNGFMDGTQYALIKEIKLPRGRNKVGRGRAVELKYRDALLHSCRTDERLQGVRDAALIAIIFGSGIRRAEAASVRVEDIDLGEGEMKVSVKGGDKVMKYIAAWAIPYMEEWLELRIAKGIRSGPFICRILKGGKLKEAGLTGRGIFYLLEERSIKAGLPFLVRPHDGRRTLGTDILTEHGELIAQRVLGHADLSTTRIYDKRSDKMIKSIFGSRIQ